MAVFYLCTLVIGYGAGAVNGTEAILAAPGGQNSAAPLLAFRVRGTVLLGIRAAVASATILAVVAGLTLTASASFSHDVYANVLKHDKAGPDSEVRVARVTALVIGAASILGGILVKGQHIAFLVSLAFAVAASANLSALLFSLFWRRSTPAARYWGSTAG